MSNILILYHSQEYGNTDKMAQAVAKGAKESGAEAVLVNTNDERADVELFRTCDAIAVGTPDYYSYIAGGLKMFFDDWHIAKGKDDTNLVDKPVGLFFSHGGGGRVKEPFETLGQKIGPQVGDTIESKGSPDESVVSACEDLGKKLAEAVS
ncbi:flavodoxin family protein [Planctomycetota bacterium]